MENTAHRNVGVALADFLFSCADPWFEQENFLNAVETKKWFGQLIKEGSIGGYRNLEYRDYKAIFDIITREGVSYHAGIDFGRQAVHVVVGPGDVFSLYYRDELEAE